jgi:hypothetical protein
VSRTIFATALAASIAMVCTAVGSGAPPTDGIAATCSVDGESVVSGFKGNPTRVDFIWRNETDGFQNDVASLDVGGKFGTVATTTTPLSGYHPSTGETKTPWSPESLTFSVIYKANVAFVGEVPCS